jgi:hypothetical protein
MMMPPSTMIDMPSSLAWKSVLWRSLRFSEAFTGRLVCRDTMMIPFLEWFYEAISTQNELYFLHVVIHAIATMMCIITASSQGS